MPPPNPLPRRVSAVKEKTATFEQCPISQVFIRTRFSDTDAIGIVHHSRFFAFFEEARETYLQRRGVDFAAIFRSGYTMPLSGAGVHFLKPLRFAELVIVEARVAHLTRARLRFEYRILRDKSVADSILTVGWTEHIYTDMQLRLCRFPRPFIEQLLRPERPELSGTTMH